MMVLSFQLRRFATRDGKPLQPGRHHRSPDSAINRAIRFIIAERRNDAIFTVRITCVPMRSPAAEPNRSLMPGIDLEYREKPARRTEIGALQQRFGYRVQSRADGAIGARTAYPAGIYVFCASIIGTHVRPRPKSNSMPMTSGIEADTSAAAHRLSGACWPARPEKHIAGRRPLMIVSDRHPEPVLPDRTGEGEMERAGSRNDQQRRPPRIDSRSGHHQELCRHRGPEGMRMHWGTPGRLS